MARMLNEISLRSPTPLGLVRAGPFLSKGFTSSLTANRTGDDPCSTNIAIGAAAP